MSCIPEALKHWCKVVLPLVVIGVVGNGCDAEPDSDTYLMTLEVVGQGQVQISPQGELCTASTGSVTVDVESDSDVTLTATPDDGWAFATWQIDPAANDDGETVVNPLTITVDADKQVKAVFAEILNEYADLDQAMASTDSDHPPVTELPAMEIPEAMLGLDDSVVSPVQEIIDAINQYKSVAYQGPIASENTKAARQMKWRTSCVDEPVPECWHVEEDENLIKTFVQIWAHGQYMYRLYYDGVFENHQYDDFKVESGFIKDDLTVVQHTVYQNPDHPVAPPGPLWDFQFTVTGQDSYLYTPWDQAKSLAIYTYSCTTSIWDGVEGNYHASVKNLAIRGPYGTIQFQTYLWSYSLEELYLWYICVHAEDGSGWWSTHDEYGNIIDYGSW